MGQKSNHDNIQSTILSRICIQLVVKEKL